MGHERHRKHCNVVLLAKLDARSNRILRPWRVLHQLRQTLEAEKFAAGVAGFEQAVGVKRQPIAWREKRFLVFVALVGFEPERKPAWPFASVVRTGANGQTVKRDCANRNFGDQRAQQDAFVRNRSSFVMPNCTARFKITYDKALS